MKRAFIGTLLLVAAGYFSGFGGFLWRISEPTVIDSTTYAARLARQLLNDDDDDAAAKRKEAACLADRSSQLDQGARRQADARYLLKRCKQEYEDKKTIFTSMPVEVYCKSPQRAVYAAGQELKTATDRLCAPSSTGSLPSSD